MNAAARVFVDPVSAWPLTLPWPQVPTVQINWDQPTDDVGTLAGPTRFRLAHPNASPSYEFEILFTEYECEQFEAWYNQVVELGGEMYLPWIGEGRIVYLTEYELAPLGTGWKLHALAVQLYVDKDYCDRHVCDAAYAWRVPVIVDADATYPVITCDLPGLFRRPRLIDEFFGDEYVAMLIADYYSNDRVIADLGANFVWSGSTLSYYAERRDTVTAYLPATTLNYPIFIDIPTNWMWDDHVEEWHASVRMTYIDDWETLWIEPRVNRCWLIKDVLPAPGRRLIDDDWTRARIIADGFPLECYFPVRVELPGPALNFTVAPTTVGWGESAVLSWTTENAHTVVASGGWSGNQGLGGKANTGPLWQTTSYTLTASGPGGEPVTRTVTVAVTAPPPAPTVTIRAHPPTVVSGEATTLTWATTDAASVSAFGSWSGNKAGTGSETIGPLSATSTFGIAATGPGGGPVQASVEVVVTAPPGEVRVTAGDRWGLLRGYADQYSVAPDDPTWGSISTTTMPTGAGLTISGLFCAPAVRLELVLYPYSAAVTKTNQFDGITVVDDAGATQTFLAAASTFVTLPWFGPGAVRLGDLAVWQWNGPPPLMQQTGKVYTFTFHKAT